MERNVGQAEPAPRRTDRLMQFRTRNHVTIVIPAHIGERMDFPAWRRPLLLVSAVPLAIAACLGLRGTIVRAEPRTSVLFGAIGLPVNLAKFEIVRASARLVVEADRRFLVVDGEVANPTAQTRVVPPLRVAVRGTDGQIIYTWVAQAPRRQVEPGEKAAFSARLASPPLEGVDVVVELDRTPDHAGPTPAVAQPRAPRQRS